MRPLKDYLDAPYNTIGAMARHTVAKYGDKTSHKVPHKGKYTDVSYNQFWEKTFLYAKALDGLGLKKGDKFVLFAPSSFEWALTDWAAQTLGIVLVPIFPTLPSDQATYIAKDCEAKLGITDGDELSERLEGITTHQLPHEDSKGFLDFAEKSTLTEEEWHQRIDEVHPDDLATIIYTSGTTGKPKGAMLLHRGFVSLSKGITSSLPIHDTDLFLSFLPLSHVYERYAGHILPVATGATIAYAGSLASLPKDMMKIKPTIMLCVPRFLENVRARILDNVKKDKPIKQKLFDLALKQGLKKQKGEFAPFYGILDKLVGQKIRDRTGGRIKFFVSGGAALAPNVTEFYQAFGLLVLQGYGLTETTAASALNVPEDNNPETVGPPLHGVQIKIAEDGEILIKGDSVMSGYYNLPKESAEAIDDEGWFHSGDIGEYRGNKVAITDRKKDIIVLANGKNVAPLPIENTLKESDFIAEVVVLGDKMDYCAALVLPDFEKLKIEFPTMAELPHDQMVENDEVKSLLKKEIQKANEKLANFEKVMKHTLISREFSIENGELTPSLKVKKRVVKEHYADEINSMQR